MSEPLYHVVVLHRHPKERIRDKHKLMPHAEAKALAQKLRGTINRKAYRVEVWRDRRAYWAKRHQDKYENDPAYRDERRERARDWSRKARAEANGDLTPWLTLPRT